MSHVTMRNGTEGPRHDPYAYTELTVERPDGRKVVVHMGLATWVDARWPNGMQRTADSEREAFEVFEEVAGVTYPAAVKALLNLPQRRMRQHPCGTRFFCDQPGYPGESFVVCSKCGDVVDSHFDRSAIE